MRFVLGLLAALLCVCPAVAGTIFDGLRPTAFVDVVPGPGALQAAVNAARPGTAILVRAGTYAEAVKLPSRAGGTDAAPIWLVSADGQGRAVIAVPKGGQAGVEGLGVVNWAVIGFRIQGGAVAGIQFSQSGPDFTHMVRRILIQGNLVSGGAQDGIKVSQADQVQVLDNVVSDVGQQGVDFVAVDGSQILRNDVARTAVAGAIMTKGGGTDVEIASNHVHDIAGYNNAGVEIGGFTDLPFFRPGGGGSDATRVSVHDNLIERVYGPALSFLGARDSTAAGNVLESLVATPGKTSSWSAIGVGPNGQKVLSLGVTVGGNVLIGPKTAFLWDKQTQDPARDHLQVTDTPNGARRALPAGPVDFPLWTGPGAIETRWAAPS